MAYRIDHYASFGWVTFMNSQALGAGVVGNGGIGEGGRVELDC